MARSSIAAAPAAADTFPRLLAHLATTRPEATAMQEKRYDI